MSDSVTVTWRTDGRHDVVCSDVGGGHKGECACIPGIWISSGCTSCARRPARIRTWRRRLSLSIRCSSSWHSGGGRNNEEGESLRSISTVLISRILKHMRHTDA